MTRTPPPSPPSAEDRLLGLADRLEIYELLARYSMARDDCDLTALLATFTADAEFERGGAISRGQAAIESFFRASFARYDLTLHTVHLPAVELLGAGTAAGLVNGHAELVLDAVPYLAAYRYTDSYRQAGGRWLFARRQLRFLYAVRADSYSRAFRDQLRIQWPDGERLPADYPEREPHWQRGV
jgi:ketosteroid isomerase-like protein